MDLAIPPPPTDPSWTGIQSWRVDVRQLLIRERLACGAQARKQRSRRAKERLIAGIDLGRYQTLGVYAPIRGEIDVLDLAAQHVARGGSIGLPVVVEKARPVEFWRWSPGAPMTVGLWNIPVPAKRDLVRPDALIVPLVGFDGACYRLGYGGGYYDRTLEQAHGRPYCIGLGPEAGCLISICPQPHDIPMNVIVTDEQVRYGRPTR